MGHGQSSTQVTLLPHSGYKDVDEATKHLPSNIGSYNLKYENRGGFRVMERENGNSNNGNSITSGTNMYAEEPTSPPAPALSKTPLPVIGGRLSMCITK